jgi:hypothetical protein
VISIVLGDKDQVHNVDEAKEQEIQEATTYKAQEKKIRKPSIGSKFHEKGYK